MGIAPDEKALQAGSADAPVHEPSNAQELVQSVFSVWETLDEISRKNVVTQTRAHLAFAPSVEVDLRSKGIHFDRYDANADHAPPAEMQLPEQVVQPALLLSSSSSAVTMKVVPTRTTGNLLHWEADDSIMPAMNDELVKVTEVYSPWGPCLTADGTVSLEEPYVAKQLKSKWAVVAANFTPFEITPDQAMTRVQSMMGKVEHLAPKVGQKRNANGGSGNDDIQRLSARERALLRLCEQRVAYKQYFTDKAEQKDSQKQEKQALTTMLVASASSMQAHGSGRKPTKRRRSVTSTSSCEGEGDESDSDDKTPAQVLTAKQQAMAPVVGQLALVTKQMNKASSEHGEVMKKLFQQMQDNKDAQHLQQKQDEERLRGEREQDRLDRQMQMNFMKQQQQFMMTMQQALPRPPDVLPGFVPPGQVQPQVMKRCIWIHHDAKLSARLLICSFLFS